MAEKKSIITAQIIESDIFLNMSLTAKILYIYYCVNADNDGFVKNPMTILRVVNAGESDFNELKDNGFIIPFDNGIIVVTHWHIHNRIRADRYKPSEYIEQRNLLCVKGNGAYTLNKSDGVPLNEYMATKRKPSDNQTATDSKPKDRTSKDKLSKDKLSKDKIKDWGGMTRDTDLEELQKKIFVN